MFIMFLGDKIICFVSGHGHTNIHNHIHIQIFVVHTERGDGEIYIITHIYKLETYSIIKHLFKCSLKYAKSSSDAWTQLVSSSSCRLRSCMMDDNPLEDNNGQPASDRTCKLRMEQRCCKPKSRI